MCDKHPTEPANHTHRCNGCGTIWHHTEKSLNCEACHTCPLCGIKEFFVHGFADAEAKVKFFCAQHHIEHPADIAFVRGVLKEGGLI